MRVCPQCLTQTDDRHTVCPKDGVPTLELGLGDPLLGTVAGERFLLLDVLGKGGMSIVYRALQLAMQREVAIKVLTRTDKEDDEELVARFTREARMTARLRSAHTIVLHDFGALPTGDLFIAMELLEGVSLAELIGQEAPFEVDRALDIVDQICDSLEEAHDVGMVHRDIKPSNVMVSGARRDNVKVVDFGLVKATSPDAATLTQAGWMLGTPAYMAPEMWSDAYGEVGPQADIYAVGATLFEMLTGRRPFTETDIVKLMHGHIYGSPPSLVSVRPDLAPYAALDAVIAQCLAKQPADRFPTAGVLRASLLEARAVMGGEDDDSVFDTFRRPSIAPALAAEGRTLDVVTASGTPGPVYDPPGGTLRRGSAPVSSPPVTVPGDPVTVNAPDGEGTRGEDSVEDTFVRRPTSAVTVSDPALTAGPAASELAPRRNRTPLWIGGVVAVGLAAFALARPSPGPDRGPEVSAIEAQPEPAPVAVDAGLAPSPEAPTTAPSVAAPTKARPPPPPAPGSTPTKPRRDPPPPKPATAKLASIRAIGIEEARAREALGRFPSVLVRCYGEAGLTAPVTVDLVLRATGEPMSVTARPASAPLSACVDGPAKALRFGPLDGARFATVSLNITPP